MTKTKALFAVLACALAVTARPALAQLSSNGGPIDINSDKLEVIDSRNEALFIGRVDALQGDARLRADKLDVVFEHVAAKDNAAQPIGVSWGKVKTIIATGHVYYVTPKQVATADKAIYDVAKDQVTMLGNVVVTQGKNVIRGDKLILQISTGRAVFAPSAVKGKSGRVRAVFFPEDKTKSKDGGQPAEQDQGDHTAEGKTPAAKPDE